MTDPQDGTEWEGLDTHDWHTQWVLTQSMLNEARAALGRAEAERDEARCQRDDAVAALTGAIDGTNDLFDKLLRSEKALAVKTTAEVIGRAYRKTTGSQQEAT